MAKRFRILIIMGLALFMFTTVHAAGHILKQGSSGEEVYKLQLKLQEYGYYTGSIDGTFGSGTLAAVMNFQIDCGLEPDGIVGAQTLSELKNFRPSNTISRGKNDERKGQQIAAFAKRFIGVPYVWSGRSPSGFDCSGFVYYVFDQHGITLPRMADGQFEVGLQIYKRNLQLGDLVFFSTYEAGPSHVGIYIGNGQFIHASSGAGNVTITPLSKPYYEARYLGARRVIR